MPNRRLNTRPEEGNVIHVDFSTESRCWECSSFLMLMKMPSGALMCGRCRGSM